jgi:phage-related holin
MPALIETVKIENGGGKMDFDTIYDHLQQSWQFKCLASILINISSYLIGEINAPFMALWTLIAMDTFIKWIVISQKVRDKYDEDGSLLFGFLMAWNTGELCSRLMRKMFVRKVFSYLVLIIVANLLVKIIPSVIICGNDWAKFPGGFIYSFLALTEMISIVENLIDMGFDALKPLVWFIGRKRNEMLGYKDEDDRHKN